MFDAESFTRDYKVPTAPAYHKHHRAKWVNIACPFCAGNIGFHLGINIEKGFAACFRCGTHWIPKVISALTSQWMDAAKATAARYYSGDQAVQYVPREYQQAINPPMGTGPLTDRARQYLIDRRFDPDEISAVWDVQATGIHGDYRNRLYIPITLNRQVISYTARDFTGKKEDADKYRACPDAEEVYHHKFALYGLDQASGDTCAVTEGCPDVWRFGPNALGTYGTKFLPQQVRVIAKRFDRAFLFFDPDPAGIEAGEKMYQALDARAVDCEILYNDAGVDPGAMDQQEINQLRKEIGI
ncbi:hypothetical protein LCGC14_1117180 [marine sediment metagenome]|uniref:Uncharacterized protein n=1 Tax=marine sediment metagenome TaxID=412755 RepID=A0A0F9MSX9_9ZZZZ